MKLNNSLKKYLSNKVADKIIKRKSRNQSIDEDLVSLYLENRTIYDNSLAEVEPIPRESAETDPLDIFIDYL